MSRANRHFENWWKANAEAFYSKKIYWHLCSEAFAAGLTQGKRQMRSAIGGKKRKAVKR